MTTSSADATTPKAGFVAIIGEPNVGKSTLLNTILGVKLSIVSKKPQTTRKRVLGIYGRENLQVVFLDTPGVLKPRYELHRSMMASVAAAVEGADAILALVDVTAGEPAVDALLAALRTDVGSIKQPVIVALNKIDALGYKPNALPLIQKLLNSGIVREAATVSALHNRNVDELIDILAAYIPQHEFYYDPDLLSEQPERFFVAELIREVVFEEYRQEIPYASEINIVDFKEREAGKWYVSAEIIIERASQKGIVIGKKGVKLKHVGQRARTAIEDHLGVPVFLELFVKVRDDWRNNKTLLHSYGY